VGGILPTIEDDSQRHFQVKRAWSPCAELLVPVYISIVLQERVITCKRCAAFGPLDTKDLRFLGIQDGRQALRRVASAWR